MAGQLTIDTLKASSGVLATQNGITGIAKAWVNFTGSSGTINGSFNVSSVTRNSTGDYTVAYTTAMTSANYCPATALKPTTGGSSTNGKVVNIKYDASLSTTSCRLWCYSTGGVEDFDQVYLTIFGA